MSNSKMLIDASHPEETRVVVLKGNRIEDFDFEAANKKQLRGNIYLAKVTRVEPSLQAAFIEYGGNRHGFLAFSEIHPDYYQIPFADRQALLEEEARAHRDEDDEGRNGDKREGRSEARSGEGRDGRNGEPREGRNGEAREGRNGEAREGRGGGSRRGGEGREGGERGAQGRGDRNERGQRRSRRHRRSQTTALEQRGPGDESISEAAFDDETTAFADDALVDGRAIGGAEGDDTFAVASSSDDATVEEGRTDGHPTSADHDAADGGGDVRAVIAPEPVDDRAPEPVREEAPSDAGEAADAVEAAEPAEPEAVTARREDDIAAALPVSAEEGEDAAPATVDGEADLGFAADGFDGTAAVAERGDAHDDRGVDPVVTDATEAEATAAEAIEARDAGDVSDDDRQAPEREDEHVEQIGGDALSDVAPRPTRLRRHYKIQEVIKRRQILLIQVVKEERGNKGAALTTYLSLAGRYSVLMPNTAKGGGISRKITDGDDRKRLKAIAGELDVPEGMGVILRTAGAARSPIEVKRDFEYLLRMWESVRELTLKSSAPTLVYEEGSLIKRSIRDLYGKEVEEIVVSGDAGFAEARDFMRMLMPGNVKSVQPYSDPQPIFAKSGVEAQLDAMFSPHVTLKSGGYLVINQTEALVAIDVNSGRSTREHNIEDTALRTNMEAADEVARQLRLRDLAGLIVVDFIDMEEGRNNRAVERRIKDALKNDRARIQIGRISHFGLLEMSRQRIRTGVLEGSTAVCSHCAGTGTVRSTASIALHVLRLAEDALIKDASHDLIVRSRAEVALYVLNQKRAKLVELEQRFGITVTVMADPTLTGMVYHALERGELATPAIAPAPRQDLVRVDSIAPIFEPGSETEEEASAFVEDGEGEADDVADKGAELAGAENGEGDGRRRRRRRRRRGRDRDGAGEASGDDAPSQSDDVSDATAWGEAATDGVTIIDHALVGSESGEPATMAEASPGESAPEGTSAASPTEGEVAARNQADPTTSAEGIVAAADGTIAEEAPKRRRSRRTPVRLEKEAEATEPAEANVAELAGAEATAPVEDAPARPRRRRPSRARAAPDASEGSTSDGESSTGAMAPAATETVAIVGRSTGSASDSAETGAAEDAPESAHEVSAEPVPVVVVSEAEPVAVVAEGDPDRPKRSGWWQRAKASFGS